MTSKQSRTGIGHFRGHVVKKERWAIAKMTTRRALYMGALKIFESLPE